MHWKRLVITTVAGLGIAFLGSMFGVIFYKIFHPSTFNEDRAGFIIDVFFMLGMLAILAGILISIAK